MSVLPIIIAPDPRLKITCAPVDGVDDGVRTLMDDMLESMYAARGIGLAAPQIGMTRRIIVVDIAKGEEPANPLRLANPEIVRAAQELIANEEGCLSLPEHYAEVMRPSEITVKYLDYRNTVCELDAEGPLATCIQHEIDHLEGILFVDHLTSLKRNIILRKLVKMKKQEEEDN